jgi:hypothetical protein
MGNSVLADAGVKGPDKITRRKQAERAKRDDALGP